ncbi:MAG: carbon-nitrogen hydrolase family protein [candidate division Zixibacteria bacterium]
MNGKLVIAMLQDRTGSDIRENYRDILREERPDILALPEYYFVGYNDNSVLASCSRRDAILKRLGEISSEMNCILIGGSVVENINGAFYNRSYMFDSGRILGHYDKIHPYDNEGRGLIKPGYEYKVFATRGIRIGIMICADVLYPDSFSNIRGLSPDLIFVPTTSPYRENESDMVKFNRDNRLYAIGAERARAAIFKVCASGQIAGHRLQARSLVATPGRVEWRNQPEFEDKSALIITRLEISDEEHSLDIQVHRE